MSVMTRLADDKKLKVRQELHLLSEFFVKCHINVTK